MDTAKLLMTLANEDIISGSEGDSKIEKLVTDELNIDKARCRRDRLDNLIVDLTDGEEGGKSILIEAHLDEIGLIVTNVTDSGFVKFNKVGGMYVGTVLGSPLTVYGKKPYFGVVTTVPPHLAGEDKDKMPDFKDLSIDLGLSPEEAKENIRPGDRILRAGEAVSLGEHRVCGKALDDRAGVAAVINAAKLIMQKGTKNKVTLALTSKEELGGMGAQVLGFTLSPDESISVDVSFSKQPGVNEDTVCDLNDGVMIGVSPILNRQMTNKLISICESEDIKYVLEAMGGHTGTNADDLQTAGRGIRCALLSIPQRNMHSVAEIVDVRDVDATARLIAEYCTND